MTRAHKSLGALTIFVSLCLMGSVAPKRNPVPLDSADQAYPLRTKDIRATAGKLERVRKEMSASRRRLLD